MSIRKPSQNWLNRKFLLLTRQEELSPSRTQPGVEVGGHFWGSVVYTGTRVALHHTWGTFVLSGEIPPLVAETAATCAWHQKQTITFRVEEEVFFLGSFLYRETSSQKPLGETFLYVSWARTDPLHMPAYFFLSFRQTWFSRACLGSQWNWGEGTEISYRPLPPHMRSLPHDPHFNKRHAFTTVREPAWAALVAQR